MTTAGLPKATCTTITSDAWVYTWPTTTRVIAPESLNGGGCLFVAELSVALR